MHSSKPGVARVRRTPEQWQQLLERQQASGLTQRQFCERHALVMSTFHYWKRRLGVSLQAEPELAPFVQLTAPPADTEAWDIELTLGEGVVLRLRRR